MRNPDYISNKGVRYWFEEMVYSTNVAGIRKLILKDDGFLYPEMKNAVKQHRFSKHIHEAYNQWKHDKANAILLENKDE